MLAIVHGSTALGAAYAILYRQAIQVGIGGSSPRERKAIMERCPNCGATVRLGAKFCTTCGMRLPELAPTEAAASSTAANRSPFESTSSVASARWPSERPSQGPTAEAAAGYPVGPSGAAQPSATTGPEAEPPPTEQAGSNAPAAPDTPADADPAATSIWPPLGRTSTWESSWRSSTSSPEAPPPPADAATHETEPAMPAAAEEEEAAVSEAETGAPLAAESAPAEAEAVAEESVVEEIAPVDVAAEAVVEAASTAEEAVAAPDAVESVEEAASPVEQVRVSAATGGLDRAHALLDELRSLLPGLTAGVGDQVDTAPIADDLASAQSAAGDRERFTGLRNAINSARERPRDIDTMLDVSGRLDVIASLHDAYERLSSAVDRAVENLRSNAHAETAPDDSGDGDST